MSRHDALIIGAGHNGLVCAWYLARAGLKVRVLEKLPVAGGAAATEEFHPGFRNSVAAYTVSLLQPRIVREMELASLGLEIIPRPMDNFLPIDDSLYLLQGGDLAFRQGEIARFSARDAERLPIYLKDLERVADLFRALMLKTPVNAGGGIGDLVKVLRDAAYLRGLGLEGQRDLLTCLASSAGELLDRYFESDPIKALLGFDSIVGSLASPYSPGSAYVLLHHVLGEITGRKGAWGHARGGMGAVTLAMVRACEARGVEISLDSPVRRILVDGGRANGVELENGSELTAKRVIANLNPRLLFTRMVDPAALDPAFLDRISRYKCASGSLRMNVALAELPDFTCLPGKNPGPHHGAGIIFGPSLEYMDRAYLDARAGGWSARPVIEMLIPSTCDPTLAPAGRHVASLFCQHFSPALADGRDWDREKDKAAELVIHTVNEYAPNFKGSILGRSVLTPLDLERRFGMIGGDIFHGAMSLDQIYAARPMLGHADYRGPIKNLYMCGSGTHPGGGVTGAPGYNAAREVLRDV